MKTIYFNEDNEHFYRHHATDEMTVEGCRKLVDTYAQTGTIKGLLFCTNVQRALFDSNVWERFRDIDSDQAPVRNLRALSERGVDHLAVWLERSRELGMENWLTMRMNDSHGLKEARLGVKEVWLNLWASRKWRENPQLRRAPYRLERSWEGSFNYLLPEIRKHSLALIEELFERYDMFGLELDWMRWGMMFAPGFEREGQGLLTEFVCQVRELADRAEKRYGHPGKLAHRVPAHPESCLNYGFDIPEWGRRGCVDMMTLSSFLGGSNFDPQIKLWRYMMPNDTVINAYVEPTAASYPGNYGSDDAFLRGAAAASWSCGADNIYLFNECYREPEHTDVLNQLLTDVSSRENLMKTRRRFPVAFPQAIIAGEANRNVLPIPLIQKEIGWDLGRMEHNITLRMPAGKFSHDTRASLVLGFSKDADAKALADMPVRINTKLLAAGAAAPVEPDKRYPRESAFFITYPVPPELLHETFNAVEILPPQIPGQIDWAELILE